MQYKLDYNDFHKLESIGIEGKSDALIKYAYKNGNGRLKQMTYANGHTMKAVYNSIGQMVAEKWFETEAKAADSTETPIAHYKYVYDGEGNIVRSIDITGEKEYNLNTMHRVTRPLISVTRLLGKKDVSLSPSTTLSTPTTQTA